jgi:hypothetical protein
VFQDKDLDFDDPGMFWPIFLCWGAEPYGITLTEIWIDIGKRCIIVVDKWRQIWSEGNLEERLDVYEDDREKQAVRWAEIEKRLEYGKALHEAAEKSDSVSL